MVRSKNTVRALSLLLLSALILPGCSSGKGVADIGTWDEENESRLAEKDPIKYKAIAITPDIDDPMGANRYTISHGDILYSTFSEEDFSSDIYRYDPDIMESVLVFPYNSMDHENIGLLSLSENENGNITAIGNKFDIVKGYEYSLMGFDGKGNIIEQVKLQDEDDSILGIICANVNDRIICGGLSGRNGAVYEISRDRGSFTELSGIPDGYILGVGPARDENGFLLYTDTSLYYYDLTSKKSEVIFEWQDVDIDGNKIAATEKYDGKYYALLSDYASGDFAFYIISEDKESVIADEPTEIVIATPWKYGLEGIVSDYNRSQDNFRVRIEEYQSDDTYLATEDDINRMMADLLGNEPYDIMDISFFDTGSPNVSDLVRQEYITDLTPFIEESETVNLSDYYESILDLCKVGDFVAAIPKSFEIRTCYADADTFDRETITVNDLIEYDTAHDEKILGSGYTRNKVLNDFLYNNIDKFVDEEKGICSFDSDEFKKIVEYASTFPTESDIYNDFSLNEDDEIIRTITIQNLDNYTMVNAIYFDGNAVSIGMPGCDAEYRPSCTMDGHALAITEGSENKEGAWDFIEFFLSKKPSAREYTIPSNKAFLDELLDEFSEYNSENRCHYIIKSADDTIEQEYERHPLTATEREEFINMIEASKLYTGYGASAVRVIVTEELDPYFAGQKELDDCIKVIQNRVSLYLTENAK